MISDNICRTAEFNDSIFYEAICSCHADNHNQTLIVEFDPEVNDVNLSIYSKVITQQFTSWNSRCEYNEAMSNGDYFKIGYYKAKLLIEHIAARIRFTYNIWVKGYIEAENHFIFRNEKSIDAYLEAINSAKIKIKENQMSEEKPIPKEIERKFLLKEPLTLELIDNWANKETIAQGYLSKDIDKVVRIRLSTDNFGDRIAFLTVKGRGEGKEGITRTEIESRIQYDFALQLLNIFCGNVVSKTRYKVNVGNHTWEIDRFHGVNEGLWIAEIELKSEDEEFVKPSFIGEEVTHDPKYTNVRLADHPFKDW